LIIMIIINLYLILVDLSILILTSVVFMIKTNYNLTRFFVK
jgi:hypothetical protein